MIFRRRKHKLPSFPPHVAPSFERACKELSPEELEQLREHLMSYATSIREEMESNRLIQRDLVEALIDRSRFLIEHYEEFPPKHRRLAVGAVRYVCEDADSAPDTAFATGLDDDAHVMNYVLESLGVDGMFIEIG